ncbi:MAG: BatA and WFA domain-containing protein, partial [Clostridia bacterium]|nr:BatA and WFA domain-containing protein [Clostridia bacterium]
MSILIPLGLLGLLSIVALILIYIIKPNYQQKRISSSYVWKLSLKYKKKTIPVSRLSQILIFLCQLLVLTLCAIMLAKPAILEERVDYKDESVVIIDASASMMVTEAGESRFERAVSEAITFAENVMDNDGVLSVIVAEYNSYFLAQRSSASDSDFVLESLKDLYSAGVEKCTYGSADLEGAITLAEEVLDINSNAKVYLYT